MYERATTSVLGKNMLLHFSYADFEEGRMKYEKVHTIYQKIVDIEDVDPTLVCTTTFCRNNIFDSRGFLCDCHYKNATLSTMIVSIELNQKSLVVFLRLVHDPRKNNNIQTQLLICPWIWWEFILRNVLFLFSILVILGLRSMTRLILTGGGSDAKMFTIQLQILTNTLFSSSFILFTILVPLRSLCLSESKWNLR